jgi:N-acylglucosamine 2-epimerase
VERNDYLTQPYPIPEGFCTHGIPMILLNSVHEYIRMKQSLGLAAQEDVEYARSKLEFILTELYDGNGHIYEYKKSVRMPHWQCWSGI